MAKKKAVNTTPVPPAESKWDPQYRPVPVIVGSVIIGLAIVGGIVLGLKPQLFAVKDAPAGVGLLIAAIAAYRGLRLRAALQQRAAEQA